MTDSKRWQMALATVSSIGVTPEDDEERRLQRAILIATALMVSKDLAIQLMRKDRELEQAYLQQEIMLRQSEKLATLGRLSAGMAHELNNPAAAAQRGAEQLREAIAQLGETQYKLGRLSLSECQLDVLTTVNQLIEERIKQPAELDPLTLSDREYEMESWLEDQGVDDAWEPAPMLVSMAYEPDSLAELGESFTAEQFPSVVTSLCNLCATHNLLEEIGQGAGRIAEIVKALRCFEVRLPVNFEKMQANA